MQREMESQSSDEWRPCADQHRCWEWGWLCVGSLDSPLQSLQLRVERGALFSPLLRPAGRVGAVLAAAAAA